MTKSELGTVVGALLTAQSHVRAINPTLTFHGRPKVRVAVYHAVAAEYGWTLERVLGEMRLRGIKMIILDGIVEDLRLSKVGGVEKLKSSIPD